MRFALRPELQDSFEQRMEALAPWFHSFCFGEQTFTGYYKHQGLGWDVTWSNPHSPPDRIARLRAAYERRDIGPWRELLFASLRRLDLDPRGATALDISSATGRNSFLLADHGFKRVIASEIRANSHEQHRLILASLADDRYARATDPVNDPVSADDPAFPGRYRDEGVDLACSLHLLYHLTNPVQHLINLHRITKRYALVFTKTHHAIGLAVQGKRGWLPTIEPADDIANAAFGFGWTPHFHEVPRVCADAGFDLVAVEYLEPFKRNFPYYADRPRNVLGRMLLERAASRLLRRPVGHCRNLDPEFHGPFHVDPRYFMFILRKTERGVRHG